MNPGFSSTTGVQIAMTRFNQTKLNSMTSTVDVGAGLIWDQVYKTLEPTGVNVLGGRIPGIGVAGLTLGGGECLPSLESSISYAFRLLLFNKSIWTCSRQRCWI